MEQVHFHRRAQQFFYILKGEAIFCIENDTFIVRENMGIHIIPGKPHFIGNKGETELEFLVISQPSTNNDRTNIL